MKTALYWMASLSWLMVESVCAASFGRREAGVIASINDKPAICLPKHAKKSFSVGWISLTETRIQNPRSWGASLLPGLKPLELSPGACMVWGVVPEGYEFDNYKIGALPLTLEVDRTYIFSLSDAHHPRDSYDVVFCVNKTATGAVEYLQYIRLADGSQIVPVCDARRNANVIERDGREGIDK